LSPARIIIAMQPLLGEIIENSIAAEPDMIIAGAVNPSESVGAAAKRLSADIVILGEGDETPGDVAAQLLGERPQTKLFVVAGNGRSVTQYSLKLNQIAIEDISPSKLVQAIRAATTDRDLARKGNESSPCPDRKGDKAQ
jgi:DNA-binding NarL/FixJ family response regulator